MTFLSGLEDLEGTDTVFIRQMIHNDIKGIIQIICKLKGRKSKNHHCFRWLWKWQHLSSHLQRWSNHLHSWRRWIGWRSRALNSCTEIKSLFPESNCLCRWLCGPSRSFHIRVFNQMDDAVLHLDRACCRCEFCCCLDCCCCQNKMVIRDIHGAVIGSIRERYSQFSISFMCHELLHAEQNQWQNWVSRVSRTDDSVLLLVIYSNWSNTEFRAWWHL